MKHAEIVSRYKLVASTTLADLADENIEILTYKYVWASDVLAITPYLPCGAKYDRNRYVSSQMIDYCDLTDLYVA